MGVPQKRPSAGKELPQPFGRLALLNRNAIMFATLINKLRRWIGYRPERRYMRGAIR